MESRALTDGPDCPAARSLLAGRWRDLCDRYLPVVAKDSVWRFSRAPTPDDPEQGWKLHLSATIFTANESFERIAPLLFNRGVLFKAPATLGELEKINCGLYYGYSQVGKFVTVYPQSEDEARRLARRLHRLTVGLAAPPVPFDLRFGPGSNVYYRYGAFAPLEIRNPDGTVTPSLRNPDGDLVPDLRESVRARPAWVSKPLIARHVNGRSGDLESPLRDKYRAFRALTQRGKGGVYQAIDLTVRPARLCLLKEGRRNGETSWDGRDSSWRVRHERGVLDLLSTAGVCVPRVYASFEANGNFYLVTEYIPGESLHDVLRRMRKRMSVARALRCGSRLASLVAQIHSAGWAWRDCNPSNILVVKGGALRPLDFEGACPFERPDPAPWGTDGFTPQARLLVTQAPAGLRDDLYAVGAVTYLLLTGRRPDAAGAAPASSLRRDLPPGLSELLEELLSGDPARQPPARRVSEELEELARRAASGSGRREIQRGGRFRRRSRSA